MSAEVAEASPVAQTRRIRPTPARRARSAIASAENRAAYTFLIPWFIGLFGITIAPMIASLYFSFTNYEVLSPPQFIGTANYQSLVGDRRFMKSLGVTFTYVVWSVPLILAFSLGIAVALNRGLRGLAIYRSLFYVPSLIGGSVGIGLLWYQVFGDRGIYNDFLELFGIPGKAWTSNPATALWTVIGLHVWTFGSSMVIFLAALRQIPESYYEAASIDGASGWQRFWRITLPLITPVLFFNMLLLLIGSFQSFTQAFVVSRGTGGPVDSTLLYSMLLYERAFTQLDMGVASAMAWVLLMCIALLTAFIFWTARFWVFYGDD